MYIGIDIGSTASKVAILDEKKERIVEKKVIPSGWNMRETSEELLRWLKEQNYYEDSVIVATGYGRVSVPFAKKTITEITCHAKGSEFLRKGSLTVVDIGGQDTKVIIVDNGFVSDFLMNDKCSAGTGKFLEVMANRLGLTLDEMFEYAERGKDVKISSMCTVFAESEIISLMGNGTPKEDIACGVVNSIITKVSNLAMRKQAGGDFFLTGGFSNNEYVMKGLSKVLGKSVYSHEDGRFAGAIGAALLAK